MKNTNGFDVKALARRGASLRIAEIERECAALTQTFPDLGVKTVTAKTATPATHRNGHGRNVKAAKEQQRERAARVLGMFDRRTPLGLHAIDTADRMTVAALGRHGYLTKKANGYVRTAKAHRA